MIDVPAWRMHVFSERGPHASLTRYLLGFLSLYEREGAVEFLTTQAIAQHTRLAHNTVIKHLKLAVDAGWLDRAQHQRNTTHWRRFDYFLRYPEGFHGKQADAAIAPRAHHERVKEHP